MSSINVNFEDLANITADVVCATGGGLEIVPAGVKIKDEVLNAVTPAGGATGEVLTKDSNADYDYSWAAGGGGGSSALYEAENFANAQDQTATAEEIHAIKQVSANLLATALASIRIRAWGVITNNTTAITFTPQIRWNTSAAVGGVVVATGPAIVGTTTAQSNKAWELESVFTFIGANRAIAKTSIINHTEDSAGAAKINCINNGLIGVSLVSINVIRYIMLTWQLSATTGTPHIITHGGVIEFLGFAP